VQKYFACEIEKNAVKVSQKNYPDIIQLGDVRGVHTFDEPIDLLVGGSPCTDLSIAKKDRKGLEGKHSSLFWEYVRIKDLTKPKWFILENVASMPKKDKDIITETLGVEPILINASLVSAQMRKRLFWTNIPVASLPEDRGILLKDILQPDADVDEEMTIKGKSFCLTSTYHKVGENRNEYEHNKERKQRTMVKVGHIGNTDGQANRVYDAEGKACTLSANGGGSGAKTGLYAVELTKRQKVNLRDTDDKAHCLTSTNYKGSQANGTTLVENETRIRKLTPIECERLQGLPDNYTEGIAKTNRYKCLGNAFNVDVIAHILSFLP
jgi:DNA (cytosine-5)-methyltransferase 3A